MTNLTFGNKIQVLELRRTRNSYNFFMDFINLENNKQDMSILDATGSPEGSYFRNNQPNFGNGTKFWHNKAVLISSIKFKENPNEDERLTVMKEESDLVECFTLPIWNNEHPYKSYYEYRLKIDNKNEKIILEKIFEEHKDW